MSDNGVSDKLSDKRSVRGIADAEWKAAYRAAKRARRPIGEWLSEAIRAHIEAEHEPFAFEVMPAASGNHVLPLENSPEQIVRHLVAYRRYLEMRGLTLAPRGKVMSAAERLMQRAMADAGMPVPVHVRRISGR